MKKQLVIVGIALVLLIIGLGGCDEKATDDTSKKLDTERIVGTWEASSGQDRITFTADGYWYWFGEKGNYWFEDDYINSTFIIDNQTLHKRYKFSFETDNTLILESEDEVRIYTRAG